MTKNKLFYAPDYEKKYKRLLLTLVVIVILFASFIYINFDYFAFKFFITLNYAYTDTLDTVYKNIVSEESFKGYLSNFDQAAIGMFTEKLSSTGEDNYTYLYTPRQYEITKEYEKEIVSEAIIREEATGVVYMYLPSISKYTRKFVMDNLETLAAYDNIIIDLQSNPGGTLNDMYEIADLFLESGQVIAYEKTRNFLTTKTIKATGGKKLVYNNIVILLNSGTASACEGLTMALKENLDGVLIAGETSYGKGIGQFTMPLKSGFAVKATVMQIETPSGGSIHKVGITPDYIYEDDDIITYALSLINTGETEN